VDKIIKQIEDKLNSMLEFVRKEAASAEAKLEKLEDSAKPDKRELEKLTADLERLESVLECLDEAHEHLLSQDE
jgi:archaellum component FlaC